VSIDTLANCNFVFNKDLLCDIKSATFQIRGSTGMGGGTQIGTLSGFGEAVYLPQSGVNGISAKTIQQYKSEVEPGVYWRVHINQSLTIDFTWSEQYSSYSLVFTEELLEDIRFAISSAAYAANSTTIKKLESGYPKYEIRRARAARHLLEKLYFSSEYQLARTLTNGAYLNCTVTAKYLAFARSLYGIPEAVLAGKTKDMGPVAPTEVLVPMSARRDQTAYCDVFWWRFETFLLFILKPMYMVVGRYLSKGCHNSDYMEKAILSLIKLVQSKGFTCSKIVCDPASTFASLVDVVPGLTCVGAGAHVADAEVEIRVLEERCRCMESSLLVPVPRRLCKWEVLGAFVARNVVLRAWQTITSRESMLGVKYCLKTHLRAKFFDYIQAVRMPADKVGAEPRTVAALYLMTTGNQQGSIHAFDLTSEAEFTCDRFTIMPMSELVVNRIIALFNADEPATRRKQRSTWRLARRGAGNGVPLLPPPDHEDGNIADVVEIPEFVQAAPDGVIAEMDREPDPAEFPLLEPQEERDVVPDQPTEPAADGNAHPEAAPAPQGAEPLEDADEEDVLREWTAAGENMDLEPPEGDAGTNLDPTTGRQPAQMRGGERRSTRLLERRLGSHRVDAYTLRAYRTSLKKALQMNSKGGREAVMAELQQIVDKRVWAYMKTSDLSKTQMKKVIRSLIFVKEKVDASGKYVKTKARLVAGGDGQDKTVYDDISAPTVSLEVVMMVIAIAAIQRRKVATVDITGAYLECEMPDTDEVLMELDPILAQFVTEVDPTAVQYLDTRGMLVVKLQRALYGCVQSAKLWFDKLKGVLESFGFVANPYDVCTFNKDVDGVQVTVAFHVDDLLVTLESDGALDQVIKHLKESFTAISVNKGDVHHYLGMKITIHNGFYSLDMSGYLNKLFEGRTGIKHSTSPAKTDLMQDNENSPLLDAAGQKRFHSDVAKILFVTKRVRQMALPAVSILAGRVNKATVQDDQRLDKLLGYLLSSADLVLKFKCGGTVFMLAYVDAAWAIHDDRHGRTGIVIMIACCCVGAWSFKQKIVTISSTECEIVALSDACRHIEWYRLFLMAQGHVFGPVTVFQDNQSVIALMSGPRKQARLKSSGAPPV
jgi:hypothetical protein